MGFASTVDGGKDVRHQTLTCLVLLILVMSTAV